MEGATSSPGVRFPPPFYAALAVLAGWWLQRRLPLPGPDGLWRWIPGWLLVALALGLMLAGALTLRRHRTTIRPDRAATSLVQNGPYALTRNPLYLALSLAALGCAFLLRAPWIFILWPAVVLIFDRFVILREERHLKAVFGDAYEIYRTKVRRWI